MDLELSYLEAVGLVGATAALAVVGRAFPLRTALLIGAAVTVGLALVVDPGVGTFVVISALGLALLVGHVIRQLVSAEESNVPLASPSPPVSSAGPAPAWENPDGLSPREVEVLGLIAGGQSNQEIADTIHVSMATVKTHVNHIFSKTGVRDRAQAVAYAYEQGLTGSTPGLIDGNFHLGGDVPDA